MQDTTLNATAAACACTCTMPSDVTNKVMDHSQLKQTNAQQMTVALQTKACSAELHSMSSGAITACSHTMQLLLCCTIEQSWVQSSNQAEGQSELLHCWQLVLLPHVLPSTVADSLLLLLRMFVC